jgi:2'-5' RNA ligase
MNSITNYVDESSWQEDWQKDYKYGIILFIPPEPTLSYVNELRKKYDEKSYHSFCAHISLTQPLPRSMYESDIEDIKKILSNIEPFQAHYGPVINFLPVAPGVVFDIKEQNKFIELYKKIETTPLFSNMIPRKWPFQAHMTVAEFINKENTAKLTEELNKTIINSGNFICDTISYVVPDENFHFTVRKTFRLGKY